MKPASSWLRRHLLLPTCRQATELMVAREDRPLRTTERLSLAIHLPMCVACRRIEGQFGVMRQALQQWRSDGSSDA